MSQNTNLKTGGIVFQQADLRKILAEPDTKGLAFVLSQPGMANTVDLQVVKVMEVNGQLEGEIRAIPAANKKAAESNFHYPAGAVSDYQFYNLAKLKSDAYYFGYQDKAVFLSLFSDAEKWEEVFVGGGEQSYPPNILTHTVQTNWFNFIIAMRKALPQSIQNGEGTHPNSIVLPLITKSSISANDLLAMDPSLFSVLDQKVAGLVMAADGTSSRGIKFEDGTIALFHADMEPTTIRIDDNQKLKALSSTIGSLSLEESNMSLGDRLPYYRWAIGCPPQWYQGLHDKPTESDDIRAVIDKVLGQ